MKKVFLALAAAAMIFVGCSKDDDKNSLSDKIQGKWIFSEMEGEALPTNMKIVFTFEANSHGYRSVSSDELDLWLDNSTFTYSIDGDVLTMLMDEQPEVLPGNIVEVKSIDGNSMVWVVKFDRKDISEGLEVVLKLTRVTKDYSADVLGKWEGRSTGEDSEFDDGENHRWEYLANGTFRYYHKVDGTWQLSNDEYAKYFVDGNLLCTCWKNNGAGNEEHREWWEISINGDTMNWTALRMREDGTTYTATFQMVKVPANK